ncbi:f-box domain containing protein [Grosmannia clavigera kw1407]|uniref:F-box domain containing protein n=1 Tax=Grosmannia clavigera (strain kw1407 / UAMH 11150) TaxID=655863 RepID=F0XQ62_GROCL|nr:f-box domain containing protein [Grosmannia clavigera kw1407]EFX00169.1 f-box domain containing protein [Grosmannia clavigera kw1407]
MAAASLRFDGPVTMPARPAGRFQQLPEIVITEEHTQTQPSQHLQIDDREHPGGIADMRPKHKGRERFLRGLSRMASSPSLAQSGRARSASTPYTRSGVSLSCVSLAPTQSPFGPSSSSANGSAFAFSLLGSPENSPLASSPALGAIRRVDLSADGVGTSGVNTVSLPADLARLALRPKKNFLELWKGVPHEIQVYIFSFLKPKELVRLSGVNREFRRICFDGQLWTRFDASEFYQEIPMQSLCNIIAKAGPFVKDLNLRGCIQVKGYDEGKAMSQACTNLVQATLEGSNINCDNLETLLRQNKKLAHVNLMGLCCVHLPTCMTIAQNCTQLEVLNLSWCKNVAAEMIVPIINSCPGLRDLRIGEVRGLDNLLLAKALFRTNRLERLVLSGCQDLTDVALCTMLHGTDPEIDLLTDRPNVPPRRLRHLDLSRCRRLTNRGVAALGYSVPDLEGLVLAGCTALTDGALEPIFASTPRLAYLDLEDLSGLTNGLLSGHLARAACARSLTHLSIGYCENLGDAGVLPMIRACTGLRSVDMDNTRISDLVLTEAVALVRTRSSSNSSNSSNSRVFRPRPGLSLTVYDCPSITWTGVREVLSRNAEMLVPRQQQQQQQQQKVPSFPSEIIMLKCFYGWQMTVDEHTKRVLRGNYVAAARLERKWGDYMQANEEAGAGGAGVRRRRRRAREAQQVHADEAEVGAGVAGIGDGAGAQVAAGVGGTGIGVGRRRARTTACAIM